MTETRSVTLRATVAELIDRVLVRVECPTGKARYASKREAAATFRRFAPIDAKRFRNVFRCGYCDGYHLGHRRGR